MTKTQGRKARKRTEKGTVLENKEIAEKIFCMEIKVKGIGAAAAPGQFVNIKVREEGTDPLLRIPLGIFRSSKEKISVLYKVVGYGTEILSKKNKKDEIDILGPLGNGFYLKGAVGKTAVLVAGGYGVSPVFALAEHLSKKKNEIIAFIGAKNKKHIICVKEFKKIGAKVHVCTNDGSMGAKGFITEKVKEHLQKGKYAPERTTIYACGPEGMINAVCKVSKETGFPAQVTKDEYMACGIGACKGCAVETKKGIKLACTDGPVFNADILKA